MKRGMTTLATALLALGLSGCSGGNESQSATADSAGGPQGDAALSQSPPQAAQGDCDLLDPDTLERAFGSKLTFTGMSGRGERGGGCTVSVAQGEESQIILQVGDAEDYAARKDAYGAQGLELTPVNLGREAFIVNDAQLIGIDDENRSISLSLSLVVFDGEPPLSGEEVAAGIEQAGGEVLANMKASPPA